jgi:hypothetical protein
LAFSNNGAIKLHCSSVNSSRRAIREVYQTIFEMASSNALIAFSQRIAYKLSNSENSLQYAAINNHNGENPRRR